MSNNFTVLVQDGFLDDSQCAALEALAPAASFVYAKPKEAAQAAINAANVILGNFSPQMVCRAEKLQWMQLWSAGNDAYIQLDYPFPASARLTNASGSYGRSVAEHMLAMLMALAKNLPAYRDNQTQGRWQDEGGAVGLHGATALVLGLGDIGGSFARYMQALGARTIGVRRTAGQKPPYVDELYTGDALDSLLPRADIVAMALPATAETKHILSAQRIATLKRNAIVLNVGRGNAIDLDALCAALQKRRVRAAGLDVTDPEPLPEGHPLWKAPGALITPHVAGGRHIPETDKLIFEITLANFEAFIKGTHLRNIVDFSRGY